MASVCVYSTGSCWQTKSRFQFFPLFTFFSIETSPADHKVVFFPYRPNMPIGKMGTSVLGPNSANFERRPVEREMHKAPLPPPPPQRNIRKGRGHVSCLEEGFFINFIIIIFWPCLAVCWTCQWPPVRTCNIQPRCNFERNPVVFWMYGKRNQKKSYFHVWSVWEKKVSLFFFFFFSPLFGPGLKVVELQKCSKPNGRH